MKQTLDLVVAHDGVVHRIACDGEIDLDNCAILEQAIEAAVVTGGVAVEVDLADVGFIDSSGIAVLVRSLVRSGERGASLVVTNPTLRVRRALEMCGVADLVTADA